MTEVFDAVVMYQRSHKERDLLVKMLTKQYGKRMFYIRNAKGKRYPYAADLQPLTRATYEGVIHQTGLSFINDVKTSTLPIPFLQDVELNAYMTYILGLIDAAFVDNQPLPFWYDQAVVAEEKMIAGVDAQGLANFFEVKLLTDFGVQPEFGACVVCGRQAGPLDFSMAYSGALCERHWQLDEHRFHLSGKVLPVLARLAQLTDLRQLNSLSLSTETKHGMTQVLDAIYDDQVGVQLKAKRFIQQLHQWDQRLQKRPGHVDEA
ncbi:DNA repair protein RecO [Weissella halotolerans]|uniref:DNA repair protein RecO n=1 Tax=Weissella halotolerans DSM 20190 TaxID=1123500 RepID=A0A0R2FUH3_9LACO|nr:DNA repair protein RecO [Weissella halotolerans]KRN31678.1 recombination protein O [Weissella halotolerans DSM 20190]